MPATRAAVTRALPILQRSAANFASQRACVSCHHNSLAVITLRMAQERGFNVDTKALDAVEARTFRELRNVNAFDDAVQVANLSDPTPNDSYLLMAARAAGVRADLTTGVYARRIARWQREDGHWITSDFRPPHSSSVFTATATAIRAVQTLPAPGIVGGTGRCSSSSARVADQNATEVHGGRRVPIDGPRVGGCCA